MRNILQWIGIIGWWISTVAFLWINRGFSGWFLVLGATSVIVYITMVSLATNHSLQVERFVYSPKVAGSDAKVIMRLRSIAPILGSWMVVRDHWKVHEEMMIRSRIIFPGRERETEIRYTLPHVRRGIYRLDTTEIIRGDLFGLIKKRKQIHPHHQFVVYPKPYPIDGMFHMNHGWKIQRPNRTERELSGETRNYLPGDALNRIHWKQSARSTEMKVRKTESFHTEKLWVALNVDLPDQLHESNKANHFEQLLEVVCGVFQHAGKNHIPVGLISNHPKYKFIPVQTVSTAHTGYHALADMESVSANLPFSSTLRNASHHVKESSLILVTSNLSDALTDEVRRMGMAYRMIHIVYLAVHPEPSIFVQTKINHFKQLGCPFHTMNARTEQKGGTAHEQHPA